MGEDSVGSVQRTERGIKAVAAMNIGVPATQGKLAEPISLYLPSMRRVQTELRRLLR